MTKMSSCLGTMQIVGEYYHVYNRGAHKALIFHDKDDYDRFTALLYVANSSNKLVFKDVKAEAFFVERGRTLVDIFAYCLMPNHFHVGILEKEERGTERFLKKLCIAYSMYYNKKYRHSGTLFQGSSKIKHVDSQEYLQYLVEYIHLNPFGIENPELFKEVRRERHSEAVEYSKNYAFSSFRDYLGVKRVQGRILSKMTSWK